MALEDDDLAILSARFGVARFGASRFGFYPCEVEGTGHDEPGEYIWKEQGLPTTDWTFVSGCFVCRGLTLSIAVDDTTPCTGDSVAFTSTVTGGAGLYTYSWDFGDGSGLSTEANPDYTYNSAGSYTATLTVTDDWGQTVSETIAMAPYICGAATGTVQITVSCDWVIDPPEDVTFDVYLQGPLPAVFEGHKDAVFLSGDFVDFYAEKVLTWTGIPVGTYNVLETDPGIEWAVEVPASPITVLESQTTEDDVTNVRSGN